MKNNNSNIALSIVVLSILLSMSVMFIGHEIKDYNRVYALTHGMTPESYVSQLNYIENIQ